MYIGTSVPGSLNKNRQQNTNIFICKKNPNTLFSETQRRSLT